MTLEKWGVGLSYLRLILVRGSAVYTFLTSQVDIRSSLKSSLKDSINCVSVSVKVQCNFDSFISVKPNAKNMEVLQT